MENHRRLIISAPAPVVLLPAKGQRALPTQKAYLLDEWGRNVLLQ
jgi:hypothetical protein